MLIAVDAFIDHVSRCWRAYTALLLVAITALSLWPLAALPPVPGSDKTHHLIAYAALMLPTALHRPRYWWLLAIAFVLFSGGIELVQPYVNRYGEWLDMVANSAGVLCGLLLGRGLRRWQFARIAGCQPE